MSDHNDPAVAYSRDNQKLSPASFPPVVMPGLFIGHTLARDQQYFSKGLLSGGDGVCVVDTSMKSAYEAPSTVLPGAYIEI